MKDIYIYIYINIYRESDREVGSTYIAVGGIGSVREDFFEIAPEQQIDHLNHSRVIRGAFRVTRVTQ